eukprot:TRINITY_DN3860_c0_g1_i1.p1 TRINITY_DN3860_c0_g1~~TRINITY_DN3860_c0_g1_i1.p1  ORF type:complete len:417 (-),score=65.20 TRINITY_DN3860_c0_g1_i1:165-1415(-)
MQRLILVALLFISTCFGLNVFQLSYPPPLNYICYKLGENETITIDGQLNDDAWNEVPYTPNFVDIQGSLRPLPRYETNVKMRYDDNFLYVGGWIQEPHIIATITKENSVIFYDNDFEIFINPSGNIHEYNEYEVNALNTTWTLIIVNPYSVNYNIIDPYPFGGLTSAVYINGTLNDPQDIDYFWSIEIALPFNVLRQFAEMPIPPEDEDQWRINFSRVEWNYTIVNDTYVKQNQPEDNWVWSPQWVVNMHVPQLYGFLQFSTESPRNNVGFNFQQAAYEIQQVLAWIYNSQKVYYTVNSVYATSFSELDISMDSFNPKYNATPITSGIKLNQILAADIFGYDASVIYESTIYHVRGDQKQWTSNLQVVQNTSDSEKGKYLLIIYILAAGAGALLIINVVIFYFLHRRAGYKRIDSK